MTREEKIAMVEKIRAAGSGPIVVPQERLEGLDRVSIMERYEPTRHGDAHFYIIKPLNVKPNAPCIMNIHGGGFCKGHEKRDNIFSAFLALSLDAVVLDMDYKLAPEYPFPIGYQECYDILLWAIKSAAELGIDTNKLATVGHSSGGNFAAAIGMEANRTKDFTLCYQVLDYPPMDLYTNPAEKPSAALSHVPAQKASAYNSLYVDNEEDKSNPMVSPVFATPEMLEGIAPTLVITAAEDALRDEAEQYALLLAQSGVTVTLKRFQKGSHGFTTCYRGEEWEQAQDLITACISNAFAYK